MKSAAYKLKPDKPSEPVPNHLKISAKRTPGFYVYVIKSALENHPLVQLDSLGSAHFVAVNAVDILKK